MPQVATFEVGVAWLDECAAALLPAATELLRLGAAELLPLAEALPLAAPDEAAPELATPEDPDVACALLACACGNTVVNNVKVVVLVAEDKPPLRPPSNAPPGPACVEFE